MFAGDRTTFRFPSSTTRAALAGTCGLMVVAGSADAATLAADVASASGLSQAAGYDPATMALLVLAFVTMAVAGRAVRRRTVKDIISAERRRRTN
ncbi:hypothetical protein MRS76_02965 [Rhizobiaceae bacterium n13]|uniref:Secreted protein with PEP-CTERM sorting signal n=1 Tax=Ferirhizobium litorale TaxID=2927786 RepID=A0AAE3Q9X8_9HYPH|nr:hypothetical protein [Fererhizobium litorale]MDI7860907.1 hypothetical protein [Fererhizobium litorale]MDI7921055.1 hypothetical protein [Fererhizobium litorale]